MQLRVYLFFITGMLINLFLLYISIYEIDYKKHFKNNNSKTLEEVRKTVELVKESLSQKPVEGSMTLVFISFISWLGVISFVLTLMRIVADMAKDK